ncbi:DUF397 domain-containing protein [Streptomyces celluloflavus]|uniref:DUF397 domain-containing protein n=1 Tax=Streptomyces celluloflavus TaxID=58344 RepID=A0ABW7RN25_9ACTN|nr:DUF397 domain-containing protein [Streptomyces celluloflavus]
MADIPNWRTSTYTKNESCVEVADNHPEKVLVRDSKGRAWAVVAFRRQVWSHFVEFSKRSAETGKSSHE